MIESTFKMTKVRDHNSTFANRLLHRQTNQIIIGAWVVDMLGRIRTFEDLLYVRVAATAEHLTNPETMVYMLGMEGPLWECDVMMTLNCSQVFDLVEELGIPASQGEQPHFKAAHTMNGRLVVACITTKPNDTNILHQGGRLAEWKGPEGNWTIIEETAFVEVIGRNSFGRVIYALGRDYRSVILKVLDCEVSARPDCLFGPPPSLYYIPPQWPELLCTDGADVTVWLGITSSSSEDPTIGSPRINKGSSNIADRDHQGSTRVPRVTNLGICRERKGGKERDGRKTEREGRKKGKGTEREGRKKGKGTEREGRKSRRTGNEEGKRQKGDKEKKKSTVSIDNDKLMVGFNKVDKISEEHMCNVTGLMQAEDDKHDRGSMREENEKLKLENKRLKSEKEKIQAELNKLILDRENDLRTKSKTRTTLEDLPIRVDAIERTVNKLVKKIESGDVITTSQTKINGSWKDKINRLDKVESSVGDKDANYIKAAKRTIPRNRNGKATHQDNKASKHVNKETQHNSYATGTIIKHSVPFTPECHRGELKSMNNQTSRIIILKERKNPNYYCQREKITLYPVKIKRNKEGIMIFKSRNLDVRVIKPEKQIDGRMEKKIKEMKTVNGRTHLLVDTTILTQLDV
ncbi:hypothetical protein Btru_077508 [Bulinus truncatus]|nr:hypothetical protein Btru_077508 [Bulinus truncatus]